MPVRIVLDTNSFWSDVHATRDRFVALLASASAGDVEVIVPQVVLDELTRQYGERLAKTELDLDKAVGKADNEYTRLGVTISRPTISKPVATEDYPRRLRKRLLDSRVRIAPHPADFASFIGRCVAKRKPFKESGEGLPDALIWAAVASASRGADVILVTANTKDFGDPSDPTRIHPDLAAELTALNIRPNRVRIVRDLDALINEIVTPLTLPDARAERLIQDPVVGRRLQTGIAESLKYEYVPEMALNIDVELIEDPRITGVRIRDIRLNVARELAPGRLLLDLDVTADLELEVYIDMENAEAIDFSSQLTVIDGSNDDSFVEALAEVAAVLRVEATTDLEALHVDDVDLRSVKGG